MKWNSSLTVFHTYLLSQIHSRLIWKAYLTVPVCCRHNIHLVAYDLVLTDSAIYREEQWANIQGKKSDYIRLSFWSSGADIIKLDFNSK
jgi:hypothetical protein